MIVDAASTDTVAGAATVAEAVRAATDVLKRAGIDEPAREARRLAAHGLGLDRATMIAEPARGVRRDLAVALADLVARRARGEPMGRLLGARDFWSLTFALSPATLEPRPDSETIVEAALDHGVRTGCPKRIVDLGTGSGCLLLALLAELPESLGVGLDVSPAALATARANARAHGLAERAVFVAGDWAGPLMPAASDLVVVNPPYVGDDELAALSRAVRDHDPVRALAGGPDGLGAYRRLIPQLRALLTPAGTCVLETSSGLVDRVAAMLADSGLGVVETRSDLAGHARCVVGRRPADDSRPVGARPVSDLTRR